MRPVEKKDGSKYYEYILLHVDDGLVLSENTKYIIRDQIRNYCTIEEESIGSLDRYLGGKVQKIELANGARCWAFSLSQYVQEACNNVIKYLEQRKDKFNDTKYSMSKKAGALMKNE